MNAATIASPRPVEAALSRRRRVSFDTRAVLVRNGWRLVGGRLMITGHRLLFMPNPVERLARASAYGAEIDEIVGVELLEALESSARCLAGAPPAWTRLRRRLVLTSARGEQVCLFSSHLDEAAAALESALGRPTG